MSEQQECEGFQPMTRKQIRERIVKLEAGKPKNIEEFEERESYIKYLRELLQEVGHRETPLIRRARGACKPKYPMKDRRG